MSNETIRKKAKRMGVPLWRLADELHISEFTLIRRLRHELPDGEKQQYLDAIIKIAEREDE